VTRNPLAVSWAVWQAVFLREALDRLFGMRFAWCWLLFEPVLHIGFTVILFSLIRVFSVGNADVVIWLMVGLLAFFLFRRTAVQVLHAIDSNKDFFAYRQVKPFDAALARAVLEAFIMVLITVILLVIAAMFGHEVMPVDPLLVFVAAIGLWLFACGYGIITSVCMKLVPESKHVFNLLILPLYIVSGVIWHLRAIPMPYREWLMINPIAHGLELVRLGYFSDYHAVPGVSLWYLYAWTGCALCFGLMLYRAFHLRLVMR
jgi:capsular polysaccharide transport system permease protein